MTILPALTLSQRRPPTTNQRQRTMTSVDSDHRGADLISDVLPFGRLWFSDNSTQTRTAAWDRTTCGSFSVHCGNLLSPKGTKSPTRRCSLKASARP